MDTSDDPMKMFGLDMDMPQVEPEQEVILDENLTDPQRKKRAKQQQAARTVFTEQWAPPVLGKPGLLGL